jgi:lipid A 3-O-deacylase
MKPFLVWFLSLGLVAVVGASAVQAQTGPEKGGHELELWTGGGHGVKGVASDTGVWTVGGRYGWVLTDPLGPGFLRGKFEYAVDAVPIFWVFQPGGAAYGVAVDPFAFKWNFNAHGRVVPYADLDGGALVSNRQIPPGTSRVNFTPSAALGMHILGRKFNWSAEVRYMHISNAGISALNPGINTLQLRVGVGMFTRPRVN